MRNDAKTYTLTQLHTSIENWVRESFSTKEIWITCQIAKCNEKNGHYYLELVDSTAGSRTAQAKGMIWRTNFSNIQNTLQGYGLAVSDVLKVGLEIRISVTVTFHKVFGMSLVINSVDPSTILGDIEKQKVATRKRLQNEGLISLQKTLYFGPINKRIALIGSPKTSGFEDFINELEENAVYTNFRVKIFPVGVQSQGSVIEIANAIQEASLHDVDAIAIVRGGGSKMDLHIFNHYTICQAVATCRIPIVTGIGHETDSCLIDEVAYTSMKTPTAAAELFYMNIGMFSASVNDVNKQIQLHVRGMLSQSSGELQFYSGILYSRVDEILQVQEEELQFAVKGLQYDFNIFLSQSKERLSEHLYSFKQSALEEVRNEQSFIETINGVLYNQINGLIYDLAPKELEQHCDLLRMRLNFVLDTSRDFLNFTRQKLGLVDPTRLFERGYSISTVKGEDLNKTKGKLIGKELTTYSEKHTVISIIKELKSKK